MTRLSIRAHRALLLGTVTLLACGKEAAEEGEAHAAQAVVGARTVVVAAQPFTETISAIGTVTARAGHSASLAAPAPSRVTRVFVTAGQRVSAGEPLVALDAAAFDASAQSADAAVNAARLNLERTQRLVREGVSPRKEEEAAAAELARARAELVSARRTADLATLRSPIAGVVTRMTATLGGTADPSAPLVEIADPSALDVVLNATPGDAARVRVGAKVALAAAEGSDESLGVATVVDVGGIVDSATRSVPIRLRAATTTRTLRIGETISGRIEVGTRATAIVVPTDALVPEGDGYKVFVVDEKNVAHAREVKIGARSDAGVEITSGLAAGDRVVTYGAYGVDDGATVVPPEQAGKAPVEKEKTP